MQAGPETQGAGDGEGVAGRMGLTNHFDGEVAVMIDDGGFVSRLRRRWRCGETHAGRGGSDDMPTTCGHGGRERHGQAEAVGESGRTST